MINITSEKQCCGCANCFQVCTKKCITMIEGTLGHLFPAVDKECCINCGLCEKVCPIINFKETSNNPQNVYAAYNLEQTIRKKSSSGGLFFSFANHFLNKGYTVFGSAFDETLQLKTTYVTNIEEISPLCKSKYLQSDIGESFVKIKSLLDNGTGVLYCATPCQIFALKLFLRKDYENLFLVDFFCHGVPSQSYFNQCKELVEKKHNIQITSYQFRTKIKKGNTPHYFTLGYLKDGKQKEKIGYYYESPNYAAFQSYINLRESCYNCIFSNKSRNSDITLGDFHNIDKYDKSIDRFDGVSTLIVNSKKGLDVLNQIEEDLFLKELDLQELVDDKTIFAGGTDRPIKRDEFINDYNKMSFDEFNNKWFPKKKYSKQRIYYHLPSFLRKFAKKLARN